MPFIDWNAVLECRRILRCDEITITTVEYLEDLPAALKNFRLEMKDSIVALDFRM